MTSPAAPLFPLQPVDNAKLYADAQAYLDSLKKDGPAASDQSNGTNGRVQSCQTGDQHLMMTHFPPPKDAFNPDDYVTFGAYANLRVGPIAAGGTIDTDGNVSYSIGGGKFDPKALVKGQGGLSITFKKLRTGAHGVKASVSILFFNAQVDTSTGTVGVGGQYPPGFDYSVSAH
jgi:hypothetical protein